jgi:hypothetical protein
MTLTGSTVSGNTPAGIENRDGGTLTLINSTLSGNTAGGIKNVFSNSALTLNNSTVSGNSGGGIVGPTTARSIAPGPSSPPGTT